MNARGAVRREIRAVLPAFLVARAVVAGAYVVMTAVGSNRPTEYDAGLVAWDGGWYRELADHGYGPLGAAGSRFYPLFPWLSGAVERLTPLPTSWALVLVANVAALVALVLARHVAIEVGSREHAGLAVWLTALYPASFSLVWGYSEPLMLVGVLGAWLAARRDRWGLAATLAVVAGLARPSGAALAVALVVEAWPGLRRGGWRGRVTRAAAVAAAPAAGLAFTLWVSDVVGESLAPIKAQDELRGDVVFPLLRVVQTLGEVIDDPLGDGLHAPFALVLVAASLAAFVTLPRALALYTTIVIAVSLGADNLNSLERYGLNAWPALLVIVQVLARWPRPARLAIAASGVSMGALACLAWNGDYVP